MDPYQEVLQDLLKNLTMLHGMSMEPLSRQMQTGTLQQRQAAINKMAQQVAALGQFVRNYQQKLMGAHQKAKVASASEEELVSLADHLDQNGLHALADKVDEVMTLTKDAAFISMQKVFVPVAIDLAKASNGKAKRSPDGDIEVKVDDELIFSVDETGWKIYVDDAYSEEFEKSLRTHGPELASSLFGNEHEVADPMLTAQQTGRLRHVKKFSGAINNLTNLSDGLDQNGFYALADKVDEVLAIVKTAEDYGFVPRMRANEQEMADQKKPIKSRNVGALSTRYCPDHRGVQTIRVGESIYQCPLDGKTYDYQSGYVDYEGQRVPGGSVASQTPQTSNYGGIPMRIYDSRSDVLNRLN